MQTKDSNEVEKVDQIPLEEKLGVGRTESLQTTGVTKLSRRLCRQIIGLNKAARQPSYRWFRTIDSKAVRLARKY